MSDLKDVEIGKYENTEHTNIFQNIYIYIIIIFFLIVILIAIVILKNKKIYKLIKNSDALCKLAMKEQKEIRKKKVRILKKKITSLKFELMDRGLLPKSLAYKIHKNIIKSRTKNQ